MSRIAWLLLPVLLWSCGDDDHDTIVPNDDDTVEVNDDDSVGDDDDTVPSNDDDTTPGGPAGDFFEDFESCKTRPAAWPLTLRFGPLAACQCLTGLLENPLETRVCASADWLRSIDQTACADYDYLWQLTLDGDPQSPRARIELTGKEHGRTVELALMRGCQNQWVAGPQTVELPVVTIVEGTQIDLPVEDFALSLELDPQTWAVTGQAVGSVSCLDWVHTLYGFALDVELAEELCRLLGATGGRIPLRSSGVSGELAAPRVSALPCQTGEELDEKPEGLYVMNILDTWDTWPPTQQPTCCFCMPRQKVPPSQSRLLLEFDRFQDDRLDVRLGQLSHGPDEPDCEGTVVDVEADWRCNPCFSIRRAFYSLNFNDYALDFDDVVVEGCITPNGKGITNGVFAGWLDTAPLSEYLGIDTCFMYSDFCDSSGKMYMRFWDIEGMRINGSFDDCAGP